MRRISEEEEIMEDLSLVKDAYAVCPLCGAELEKDDEGGIRRCPVCENDEVQ